MKLSYTVAVILLAAVLWGCGSTNTATPPVTDNSGNVVDPSVTEAPDSSRPPRPTNVEDPRDIYTTESSGSAAATGEADSTRTVEYSGFSFHVFETPQKSEGAPFASVTPIYSKDGLLSYMAGHGSSYDFNGGGESFSAFVEDYDESFFLDYGVVVISMRDGAAGIEGAWGDEEGEMSSLTFAIKEAAEKSSCVHIIVELDSRFMALWSAFNVHAS